MRGKVMVDVGGYDDILTQKVNEIAAKMADGKMGSWDEYQRNVGVVRGLREGRDALKEQLKNQSGGEDDE